MESLDTSYWDFLDYSFIGDSQSPDFLWADHSGAEKIDFSIGDGGVASNDKGEKEFTRKRGRSDSCSRTGTKACREKLRREKLNVRFMDLSSVLEHGKPIKTDKPAILDDAMRVLNQLKNEAQQLRETNEKLLEEIKSLKAEKIELREEKLLLKADKERMEKQLKASTVSPSGFIPSHPVAYQNKMPMYPSYGLIPMWHYLPPSARDTSRDHELRPPAA